MSISVVAAERVNSGMKIVFPARSDQLGNFSGDMNETVQISIPAESLLQLTTENSSNGAGNVQFNGANCARFHLLSSLQSCTLLTLSSEILGTSYLRTPPSSSNICILTDHTLVLYMLSPAAMLERNLLCYQLNWAEWMGQIYQLTL